MSADITSLKHKWQLSDLEQISYPTEIYNMHVDKHLCTKSAGLTHTSKYTGLPSIFDKGKRPDYDQEIAVSLFLRV